MSIGRQEARILPEPKRGLTEEPKQIGLGDVLHTFWRHRRLFMLVTVPLSLCGFIAVKMVTPKYEASADIVLGGTRARIMDIQAIVAETTADIMTIESEVRILGSRDVARRVVQQLDLLERPEFNPVLAEAEANEGPLAKMAQWLAAPAQWMQGLIKSLEASVFPGRETIVTEMAESDLRPIERTISTFIENLTVAALGASRVIRITYISADPALAAAAANSVAKQYIIRQAEIEAALTDGASDWLRARVERLRNDMGAAEERLAQYRQDSSAPSAIDPKMIATELAEMNERLAVARADERQAWTRLRQIEATLQSKGPASAADMLDSDHFDDIRTRIGELSQRLRHASRLYGPRHPEIISLEAEQQAAQRELSSEAARQVQALHFQAQAASERASSLKEAVERLEQRALNRDWADVGLTRLEHEAEAARELYQAVFQRYKETEQLAVGQPNAQLLNPAVEPQMTTSPNRKLLYMLVLVGSSCIGAGAVFFQTMLSQGMADDDDVHRMLGLKVYGIVPTVGSDKVRIPSLILTAPNSLYSEATRIVHAALLDQQDVPQVCMVTSAVANEGKTVLCASLAQSAALSGKRVLAVDCDFRRAQLAPALGLSSPSNGLTSYLQSGNISSLPYSVQETGLRVLPAGLATELSEPLLRSSRLDMILEEARSHYDLVLIDAPPILPVADVRILARKVDHVILVVRWRKTSSFLVQRALQRLEGVTKGVVGAVITRADLRWHFEYDRGYREIYKSYEKVAMYRPEMAHPPPP
jgi:capsular exopolysaccharide synthesis family protein